VGRDGWRIAHVDEGKAVVEGCGVCSGLQRAARQGPL